MLFVVLIQVHGAGCHRLPRRNPSIWVHFHWNVSLCCCTGGFLCGERILAAGDMSLLLVLQVLHLHIFLGLQNLLCVRLHDAGPGHPVHRDRVRHHRVYVLPAQRWGLQMVSVVMFCHCMTLTFDFLCGNLFCRVRTKSWKFGNGYLYLICSEYAWLQIH